MKKSTHPDFIEAIARGLEVLQAFKPSMGYLSLSEVASATNLPRPTARRILYTLEELGFVRIQNGTFTLTPRVLDLGSGFITSQSIWEVTKPRLEVLSADTGHSCSIAILEGSDVLYVSRVAVPKLVGLSAAVGTRFPANVTSLGKILLATLDSKEVDQILAIPSLSGVTPTNPPSHEELYAELESAARLGWAVTDQQLAPTVISIAAPIRNAAGKVVAAVNVNAHAYETNEQQLVDKDLPRLLDAALKISKDWSQYETQHAVVLGDLS